MSPDRVSSVRKRKIKETDQNKLLDIRQQFSFFDRGTEMVTSPWQHVSNFLSIQKVQRETRQDEVNNASSAQDASPPRSVQDATHTQRTRRRNIKKS